MTGNGRTAGPGRAGLRAPRGRGYKTVLGFFTSLEEARMPTGRRASRGPRIHRETAGSRLHAPLRSRTMYGHLAHLTSHVTSQSAEDPPAGRSVATVQDEDRDRCSSEWPPTPAAPRRSSLPQALVVGTGHGCSVSFRATRCVALRCVREGRSYRTER